MDLWSAQSGLQVEIGIFSLGDFFVPLFPKGARASSRAQLQATTYRAEQSAGWIRVLLYGQGKPGWAHLLWERRVNCSGGRAGAEGIRLSCELLDDGILRVELVEQSTGLQEKDVTTFNLSEINADALEISLPDSAHDARQRRCVEAELFIRWLRSLLREQPSRRAIRDRFDTFVGLCDAVEASLDVEEHEQLDRALDALCLEAKPLAEMLGVPFFPVRKSVVFLPEN